MAKGIYVGVDGIAHKGKKLYFGVDNVARRVKKAYIGIGGVARPFFANDAPAYYGTATALSEGRYNHAAASIGSHALFAGGTSNTSSSVRKTVEVYDTSLTLSSAKSLTTARSGLAGNSNSSYVLFAGGQNGTTNDTKYSEVIAYDASLTKSTPTSLSLKRSKIATATAGELIIFAGGEGTSDDTNRVDAYDASLTRTYQSLTSTALQASTGDAAGASVGGYALFSQGVIGNYAKNVVAYDSSFTRTLAAYKPENRRDITTASTDNYALFAGGENGVSGESENWRSSIDAYDSSLTVTSSASLSEAKCSGFGVKLGKYAIIAGGNNSASATIATVDAFDDTLTRTSLDNLSKARENFTTRGAATVGQYALIAGGRPSIQGTTTVDVYTIA